MAEKNKSTPAHEHRWRLMGVLGKKIIIIKKRMSDALKRCNINNKHQARCSGAKPTMRERMEGGGGRVVAGGR